MRRLLHVFASFKVGGPQIRFTNLANQFGSDYHHVLVAMDGQTEAKSRLNSSVKIDLLAVPTGLGKTWANLKAYHTALDEVRPDLLITSNWGSIEWVMANFNGRVPHLHMEDGFGPEETDRQLLRRIWTRRLVLRRSRVLLPSRTLYDIARNVWRLPERQLIYLPNGVDHVRFATGCDRAFAAAVGIPDDGLPIVGTVAALRTEKNLYRLLDAFSQGTRRRPVRLVIVGDGDERAGLMARAEALGLAARVVFTGACATPERLLPAFAVFALSSDTEQMPVSVLEAMAAGLPVAATAVGDVRAMVAAENRPFIVSKDTAALAGALSALLDDPTRRQAIGQANAIRARAVFDQRTMFEAYRSLFDGVQPVARCFDPARIIPTSRISSGPNLLK